jgi:hypothetical protein
VVYGKIRHSHWLLEGDIRWASIRAFWLAYPIVTTDWIGWSPFEKLGNEGESKRTREWRGKWKILRGVYKIISFPSFLSY